MQRLRPEPDRPRDPAPQSREAIETEPGYTPRSRAGGDPDVDRSEDRALADRLMAGEGTAATTLLDRHLDALYEFVHYRLGRDRDATEDVVQDTLLVALRQLPSFDARSSLHTWILGIAKNKLRERRRQRRTVPIDELLEQADPEIERLLLSIEREPLPDWALEERETSELVGAALSSLPPEYRRALVAKYVDELSTAEIGARSGRSEKAAESLLARARTSFARVLTLLAKRRGELS